MRPFLATCLCLSLALPLPVRAQQGWGDLDALLINSLAPGALLGNSFWLPDSADPALASFALGIAYPIIEGAAGNTGIETGLFARSGGGWILLQRVGGLFGHQPRDHVIHPDRIELTTTMLGEGEPRCCPTQPVRWSIDRATGQARRLD